MISDAIPRRGPIRSRSSVSLTVPLPALGSASRCAPALLEEGADRRAGSSPERATEAAGPSNGLPLLGVTGTAVQLWLPPPPMPPEPTPRRCPASSPLWETLEACGPSGWVTKDRRGRGVRDHL